jgi:hypothetical protein
MDPKKLADEILEQLFPQNELVEEAQDEGDEDDYEGDDESEDEGDDESEDVSDAPTSQPGAAPSGNSSRNQSSVSMKPTNNAASNGASNPVQDANGGTTRTVDGRPAFQTQTVTDVNSQANQATLQMKPSFAGVEMPMLNQSQMQEQVKTLFGADVSDEFITQATSLYEASLNTSLQAISEEMSHLFEEKLSEHVVDIAEQLESNVSDYLGYVVEEWVKENQLAVDNGLRTEIAENFIQGLKNLFAESYIEVPEDKTNVFDEMTDAIEALETRVNEEMKKNINLREQVSLLEAQSIFVEETKSLRAIDAENLRKLAENVEFSNSQDFRSKVKLLVENYSKVKQSPKTVSKTTDNSSAVSNVIDTLMEEVDSAPEQVFISENIKLYSDILGRTLQG